MERSAFFERLHGKKDLARTEHLERRKERIERELLQLQPIRKAAERAEEVERQKEEVQRRKRRRT